MIYPFYDALVLLKYIYIEIYAQFGPDFIITFDIWLAVIKLITMSIWLFLKSMTFAVGLVGCNKLVKLIQVTPLFCLVNKQKSSKLQTKRTPLFVYQKCWLYKVLLKIKTENVITLLLNLAKICIIWHYTSLYNNTRCHI